MYKEQTQVNQKEYNCGAISGEYEEEWNNTVKIITQIHCSHPVMTFNLHSSRMFYGENRFKKKRKYKVIIESEYWLGIGITVWLALFTSQKSTENYN